MSEAKKSVDFEIRFSFWFLVWTAAATLAGALMNQCSHRQNNNPREITHVQDSHDETT